MIMVIKNIGQNFYEKDHTIATIILKITGQTIGWVHNASKEAING